MSFSRTDSSPEAQRSGAAGVLLGYESSCFNHARYDGFGNLTQVNGSPIASYDANNHAGSEDANGNPGSISLPADGGSLYAATYDVENRLVATGSSTIFYAYAPGNKRVWKGTWTGGAGNWTRGSTDEITFWSVSGQKLATYALTTTASLIATQTGTNYYFGSKLIKNANGWVYSDRLGSVGKFYPYGIERPSATTNGTEKFTGYFRDSETGNDYADQRYMSPGNGRFITPDPSLNGNATTLPGNWNKYAYVGGDPINKTDPSGLCSPEDNPPCYSTTGYGGYGSGPISSGGPLGNSTGGASGANPQCALLAQEGRSGNSAAAGQYVTDCLGGGGGGGWGSVNKSYSTDGPCSGSAAQVMLAVENNFASFGNFQTTALGVPESVAFNPPSGPLTVGETIPITIQVGWCNISLAPCYSLNTSVTVTSATLSNLTFTTVPGHLLYPASISFSATGDSSGSVAFGIFVQGTLPSLPNAAAFVFGGGSFEDSQWNNFLLQIGLLCNQN